MSTSGSKGKSESREDTGMSSPPLTEMGGISRLTPLVANESVLAKRCHYKAFSSCKPPTFIGECDPVMAMKWIREMELVFDTCKCAEVDKVMFALSMLKSDVIFWWDAEIGGKGSKSARDMAWETFVARFKAYFFPLATVKRLEEEFLGLEQGKMTVREYTSKFLEKDRFTKLYMPTEERRIERYIYGLKGKIRELVSTQNPTTFQVAINAAEMTE
ncbi:hypothetical protein L6452_19733 [Arctium lappa]|uniref:Uncharacterized protein n=1 Tax=Arctium lappa TaxID=4217 RepID=A0ACB9BB80_ARCLA|nr:hypothetical protein L6452_19733 [Arctium lappa]